MHKIFSQVSYVIIAIVVIIMGWVLYRRHKHRKNPEETQHKGG